MKSIICVIIFASTQAFAALNPAPRDPSAAAETPSCTFESGDVGKMKFTGSTREEAFERTSRACLQARVQGFIKLRGDVPSTDRKILFAEDCVNKTYCKH